MTISKEELWSLPSKDKKLMDRLSEVAFEKYKIRLEGILSKPVLASRLIEKRLEEIRGEIEKNRYSPKLELEKALISA